MVSFGRVYLELTWTGYTGTLTVLHGNSTYPKKC
jgi:hypothetical protein